MSSTGDYAMTVLNACNRMPQTAAATAAAGAQSNVQYLHHCAVATPAVCYPLRCTSYCYRRCPGPIVVATQQLVGNCCFVRWLHPCAMYSCNGAYEDTAYKRYQHIIKRSIRDNDTQPVKHMKAPAKESPFDSRYCCMLLALLLRVWHGKQTRPVR